MKRGKDNKNPFTRNASLKETFAPVQGCIATVLLFLVMIAVGFTFHQTQFLGKVACVAKKINKKIKFIASQSSS